eukprot:scaffold3421_cov181-Amphora_coffeaeformis.AAC.21
MGVRGEVQETIGRCSAGPDDGRTQTRGAHTHTANASWQAHDQMIRERLGKLCFGICISATPTDKTPDQIIISTLSTYDVPYHHLYHTPNTS